MPKKKKKTWQEKLNDANGLPKVEQIPDRLASKWGTGTIVIPAPTEVNQLMKKVPKGKLTTINEIRLALAQKHSATIACPITTGIFSWVSAHAAEEQRQLGQEDITPYWRTLKTGGVVNEKYPGGVEKQKVLLEQEGHNVMAKGKNFKVKNYEKALAKLE
ncbi:MAG: MGMT family protein [Candidatus Bathyarchaeota archaeon]|nr:MGMT family protein [Candidatus Bathyarchaeota archaeon]